MKIDNDVITFDASDFAALTPEAQQALLAYFVTDSTDADGNPIKVQVPIEQHFSDRLNDTVRAAKSSVREAKIVSLKDLGAAIVDSPPEIKAQIQPLIDQAAALLGLGKVVAPDQTPTP